MIVSSTEHIISTKKDTKSTKDALILLVSFVPF